MAAAIVMPSFGMYTADGTLVSWLHPAGAPVEKGQAVLEIETDKAVQEVVAPASGRLHHVLPVGARLQEQMVIGYVLAEGEEVPETKAAAAEENSRREATMVNVSEHRAEIKATPIARRLAKERGINLTALPGSGPGGRIVEADVLGAANRQQSDRVRSDKWRVRERLPLSGVRRTIIERLKESQTTAVALTLTREVPAADLIAARAGLIEKLGRSIPLDAFFIKILALALRERPELNALITDAELLLLEEVNIGFAVAAERGLIVPVIRGADQLSVTEIGERVRELAQRARAAKLKPADVEGGTATITNLGAFEIDVFTPVLNPPQSSILGIGRIQPRPVSVEDAVVFTPMVWLSLTFDHRVADGATAAQLLQAIARLMTASEMPAVIGEK